MQLTIDIDKMDTTCFTETWGYGLLFFAEADRLGMFVNPVADTRQKAAIVNVSKLWLSKVQKSLPSMRPVMSMRLLTILDFLHRLVYHSPIPRELRYDCVLRAFDAMKRGDISVNRYELFGFISPAIKRKDDDRFLGEPLEWQKAEIDRWLNDFNDEETVRKMPPYDILMRAITLLRTDLERFGISDGNMVKNIIRRRYRHLLDDLTAEDARKDYGFRTYYALDQFLSECHNDFDKDTFDGYEVRIHSAIIASHDIDIYNKTYYEDYLCRYLRCPVMGEVRL